MEFCPKCGAVLIIKKKNLGCPRCTYSAKGKTLKLKTSEKINERFYNVDLGYRYCHVLENITQIATMYEAEYLWEQNLPVHSSKVHLEFCS